MSLCMSHGGQCLHARHMVVNVSMYVIWQSMSPCIPHGVKCLHTCHMAVNVSISHSGKYLHAYHMVVNVSIHITQRSMYPCMLHGVKCLHAYHVKKTRKVGAHKLKSTNSTWPMSKRQDEWERTSQSLPTVTDQCQKDKTSGSAQVKVCQQWLTNIKKTRRVGAYKLKYVNSGWLMSNRPIFQLTNVSQHKLSKHVCVCGEANFQLTNFHNINFQNVNFSHHKLPTYKFSWHKLSKHVCSVKQTFNLQTFVT